MLIQCPKCEVVMQANQTWHSAGGREVEPFCPDCRVTVNALTDESVVRLVARLRGEAVVDEAVIKGLKSQLKK